MEALNYPSVDLSHLPEQAKYSARLEKDYAEFERLREQVRPLVPAGVPIRPGTKFGPLVGTAQGEFGPLFLDSPWKLLIQRSALERLQAEGVQGLRGYGTQLRFLRAGHPLPGATAALNWKRQARPGHAERSADG